MYRRLREFEVPSTKRSEARDWANELVRSAAGSAALSISAWSSIRGPDTWVVGVALWASLRQDVTSTLHEHMDRPERNRDAGWLEGPITDHVSRVIAGPDHPPVHPVLQSTSLVVAAHDQVAAALRWSAGVADYTAGLTGLDSTVLATATGASERITLLTSARTSHELDAAAALTADDAGYHRWLGDRAGLFVLASKATTVSHRLTAP